jgi:hypothetical protein
VLLHARVGVRRAERADVFEVGVRAHARVEHAVRDLARELQARLVQRRQPVAAVAELLAGAARERDEQLLL